MNDQDKQASYADWFNHSMFGYPYPTPCPWCGGAAQYSQQCSRPQMQQMTPPK